MREGVEIERKGLFASWMERGSSTIFRMEKVSSSSKPPPPLACFLLLSPSSPLIFLFLHSSFAISLFRAFSLGDLTSLYWPPQRRSTIPHFKGKISVCSHAARPSHYSGHPFPSCPPPRSDFFGLFYDSARAPARTENNPKRFATGRSLLSEHTNALKAKFLSFANCRQVRDSPLPTPRKESRERIYWEFHRRNFKWATKVRFALGNRQFLCISLKNESDESQ